MRKGVGVRRIQWQAGCLYFLYVLLTLFSRYPAAPAPVDPELTATIVKHRMTFCVNGALTSAPTRVTPPPTPTHSFFSLLSPLCCLLCPRNTDVASRLKESERVNRESAKISVLLLFPFTLASSHERGRAGPMDGRWGVRYARAPDPDTTHRSAGHHSWAGM